MKNQNFDSVLERSLAVDTPALIYNLDMLRHNISKICHLKKDIPNLIVFFAVKANLDERVNKVIARFVDGADVASEYEFMLAKRSGYDRIIINSPDLSFLKNVKDCISDRDTICINTVSQLNNLAICLKQVELGIRLKSPLSVSIGKFGKYSRFGIEYDSTDLQSISENSSVNITTLHVHFGKKNLDSLIKLFKFIHRAMQLEIFSAVTTIDIGGGLFELINNEKTFSEFTLLLKEFSKKFPNCKIIVEPGEAIVKTIGFLVCEVVDTNNYNNRCEVILNCSAHNLLSWNQPLILSNTAEKTRKKVDHVLYGNACYELDVFSYDFHSYELKIGDRIIFFPMGAYIKENSRTLHGHSFPKIEYIGDDN